MLRESLRVCQEELARVRLSQEPLMEELARERAMRVEVEQRNSRLARAVEDHLLSPSTGTGLISRARRRIRRARMARPQEWRAADYVAASTLFSAAWYLGRYPEVFEGRLPPALHYVLHGASEGKDPSPEFSTKLYLKAHPEVVASGENPLVHFLKTDRLATRER